MRLRALFVLVMSLATLAAAQEPRPPRPPREPRPEPRPYPAGDSSLMSQRRASGDAVAVGLEQPECPVTLFVLSMSQDDRGATVTVRVANPGEAPVTRYAVTAWVVMADGTVKASQRFDQRVALAAGSERVVTLPIRTVQVSPSDTIVAAVIETHGVAWKGDEKTLTSAAKAAVNR